MAFCRRQYLTNWIQTQHSQDLAVLPEEVTAPSITQKRLTQQVLNEANMFLPRTIHSISKAVEVWDRFSRRDLMYLSDILESDSKKSPIPPFKMITMIEDHIDALRDLQRRAEEQHDLCAGLARKVCQGVQEKRPTVRIITDDNSWKCNSSWKTMRPLPSKEKVLRRQGIGLESPW